MAKLQTLKQKIGYNEMNDEAERRKAEKHSERTMEVDLELEIVVWCGMKKKR